jgi:hypothetical protein
MPSIGDLFVSRSRRTFHVNDDVNRSRRVVSGMTLNDGAPGGLPPGVLGTQSGPGHFNAVSPFAGFDSRFSTSSDGRGGSYVTEHKVAFSPIPGMAHLANFIHDVATSAEDAYRRSRSRG